MDLDPKIFKAYDIRGIYPTQLDEKGVEQIVKAIYTFFKQSITKETPITVALGCDMRVSSPSLFEVAKKALVDMGAQVIDVGLVSTPSFYFSVYHYGYDTGIQITASHNPKEYNGIKFVKNSPKGLIKIGKSTGMDKVKELALSGNFPVSEVKGTIEGKTGILEEEVTHYQKLLDNPKFKKFTIVADPANAMGAQYIGALFEKVDANLIKMNFELDGTFPAHQPDPLDFNNLVELQKRVLAEKADFGLAPDGDGDRLFFIDDTGEVIPATIITAIISQELLKKYPGEKVLFDIRYLLTPEKIVTEAGGTTGVTKVGHAFITEALTQTGGIFAGESSAHYFYKESGNAESQLLTILIVMKALTERGKKLSELRADVARSFESGEINYKVTNAPEILEALKEKYKDGELSTLDGIAISYPTWRFNVRTSNTEPLLRLNLEALDKATMEAKRDEVIALITSTAKTA